MSILEKHLPTVKGQLEFHQKMAAKFAATNAFRAALHKNTAEKLGALHADLTEANILLDRTKSTPEPSGDKPRSAIHLSLSPDELTDLPQALIDELTGADKIEFAIINAIEDAGGVLNLDRLLIALYRKTGDIHKREQLTSRLYRMAQKNLIFFVPGKKGVYSTEQLSAEDAATLFSLLKQKT
jgi:hypothetical protein